MRLPANYKLGQVNTAVNAEFKNYFDNKSSLADAVSKALQAGNELLK